MTQLPFKGRLKHSAEMPDDSVSPLWPYFSSACSTASNSPRSTPGSSPSLRRRVLGGRASEGEMGGDRSAGGSESPLPPTASSSTSSYPLAARHFTRNAKVSHVLGQWDWLMVVTHPNVWLSSKCLIWQALALPPIYWALYCCSFLNE